MRGAKPFKTFSAKVTDGAKSVPEAVLMMTEISAPKKITCSQKGIWPMISEGRIICESSSRNFFTISGSIMVAVYAKKSGTAAKKK